MLLQTFKRYRAPEPLTRAHPTTAVASADVPRTLLVGVDGSAESRAAFMAGLERAGPKDAVVAVHAYQPVAGWLGSPYYQRALDARLRVSERIFGDLRSLTATAPVRVSFERHEGHPAEVLARIAALRDVDEIVVGVRRLGRLRAFVGSVSRALLRTADRPVLVVPHHATTNA
jgi:nucleotide-binding universal stress UspA family protein